MIGQYAREGCRFLLPTADTIPERLQNLLDCVKPEPLVSTVRPNLAHGIADTFKRALLRQKERLPIEVVDALFECTGVHMTKLIDTPEAGRYSNPTQVAQRRARLGKLPREIVRQRNRPGVHSLYVPSPLRCHEAWNVQVIKAARYPLNPGEGYGGPGRYHRHGIEVVKH